MNITMLKAKQWFLVGMASIGMPVASLLVVPSTASADPGSGCTTALLSLNSIGEDGQVGHGYNDAYGDGVRGGPLDSNNLEEYTVPPNNGCSFVYIGLGNRCDIYRLNIVHYDPPLTSPIDGTYGAWVTACSSWQVLWAHPIPTGAIIQIEAAGKTGNSQTGANPYPPSHAVTSFHLAT